jgi:hypothetical protein
MNAPLNRVITYLQYCNLATDSQYVDWLCCVQRSRVGRVLMQWWACCTRCRWTVRTVTWRSDCWRQVGWKHHVHYIQQVWSPSHFFVPLMSGNVAGNHSSSKLPTLNDIFHCGNMKKPCRAGVLWWVFQQVFVARQRLVYWMTAVLAEQVGLVVKLWTCIWEVLGCFSWHLAGTDYWVPSPLCLNGAVWFLRSALGETPQSPSQHRIFPKQNGVLGSGIFLKHKPAWYCACCIGA